jgi:uncharacterized membrane protein YbhN (UPF0104 family)
LKLPVKQLASALCAVATLYALALWLTAESSPMDMLLRLISPLGLLASVLCLISYGLRGLRWRSWMMLYQRPMGLMTGLRLYLAGYTFTPTPGNVGEAMRGLLLAQQPLTLGQSLAIFGAERLADLVCLLLLSLPGLWWLATQTPWLQTNTLSLPQVMGMAGLALGAGLFGLFSLKALLLKRLPWLAQAWLCLASKPWNWLGLTLLAWSLQGIAVWLVCQACGLTLSVVQATGLYAMAMVGGALSMLPAGLGGTEAILTALLLGHGSSLGQAAAITIGVRLLTLWLAVAIGGTALIYSAAYRKDLRFS